MGGGNIKSTTNQLSGISGQQQAQAGTLFNEGQGTTAQGLGLVQTGQSEQSPLADFLKKIIGGDSTSTNQAIAPLVGNITQSTVGNRERIFDTTAPGAGRDLLLGENSRNQGTQIASATNNAFLQAFPQLAALGGQTSQLGLGVTGAGLQQTGAGITGLSNAATTTGNVLNAQESQKASTLNAFGQLAGAAGTAAGGIFCWIAEAVYGVEDSRTYLVRAYLSGPFRRTRSGYAVMEVYRIAGRPVAWMVRRSNLLRRAFKPLFDKALKRAIAWDASLRRIS